MSSTKNLNVAITALLNLTAAAGKVSAIVQAAHTEGRDVSDEELAGLQAADDAARDQLAAAIEAAKAESA